MKKGENGWLLQEEDGGSHNTFILNPMPNAQVCVYLMIHITKLQLQITFPKPLYIPHSTSIHRDPGHWKSCCLHYLWLVRYQHIVDHGKRPETEARHAFPRHRHMCRGGVIYFCQGFLLYMMVYMDGWQDGWMDGRVTWCHPWMDDGTDGWMDGKSFMTMMSFTYSNNVLSRLTRPLHKFVSS